MTDQEMRETVAGLVISTAELRRASEETRRAAEESRKMAEEGRKMAEEGRKMAEENRKVAEEHRKAMEAWREKFEASERSTQAERKKTERVVRQTNQQLGELGNKLGSFAEGMALPSMEKILRRRFGMNVVLPRANSRINGESLEIDVLAYDNGDRNEAFIVEVKSHLTEEGIQQILKTISSFPKFFPTLAHRKVYAILAAVNIPDNLRNKVLNQGLYLARISNETFSLQTPRGFKPKVFTANGTTGASAVGKKSSAKSSTRRGKE